MAWFKNHPVRVTHRQKDALLQTEAKIKKRSVGEIEN
jgi:hypothetical protein